MSSKLAGSERSVVESFQGSMICKHAAHAGLRIPFDERMTYRGRPGGSGPLTKASAAETPPLSPPLWLDFTASSGPELPFNVLLLL